MEEDYDGSDEELAPMVDGLSGTLCIIILVSMVFIFSGLKTASTYINYGGLRFENVKIDISHKVLYFKGGINLSDEQINILSEEFNGNSKKEIIFYGYIHDEIKNSQEKNTYNLLYMASVTKNIGSNKKVILKKGTNENCPDWNSCIYWKYN